MAKRPSKEHAAFVALTDRLLAVPRAELEKRVQAYKEQAEQNPNRRGPKRKVKPSASDSASPDATDAAS
jgi:hypothetical protein